MKLPEEFLNRIKQQLGDEYEEFLASYKLPRYCGLRVNTLKTEVEEFKKISPFALEPVPWTWDGFYYQEGEQPGKHPYYNAGLYYIQEPSAMLPGAVLNAQPGEKVLDLCAAPGGKSVQIAASMKGKGLLVCNDISPDRIKALVRNLELCGVTNSVVTNAEPSVLAEFFGEYFDRILVDAPCSGEGMFRKDEDAARSWEKFKCSRCAGMQREILTSAAKMLKAGGILVYSTCTFAPEEDEGMMQWFIERHPDFEFIEIPKVAGIVSGRPEWGGNERGENHPGLAETVRLWPHRVKGEGHYVACLRKGGRPCAGGYDGFPSDSRMPNPVELEPFVQFAKENLQGELGLTGLDINRLEQIIGSKSPENRLRLMGKNLCWIPEHMPEMPGIKVTKTGLYLGELAQGRFEPSHSLILALRMDNLVNYQSFAPDSRELTRYLKGETLMGEGKKGWTGICVDKYPLGWAKQSGGIMKNKYPKGWIRQF